MNGNSVMQQSMETWLKNECIKEPLRYFTLLYRLTDGADFYLIEDKIAEAINQIETAKRVTDILNEPKLHEELDKARGYIEDKNYHNAYHALEHLMNNTAIRAFEKVVECECGKPGG